jgi:hypothetical protein
MNIYHVFFFSLLHASLVCSFGSTLRPQRTIHDVLRPANFQQIGERIIENFIDRHQNAQTAMNIIHGLMTKRHESHAELCIAIGRNPKILTDLQ